MGKSWKRKWLLELGKQKPKPPKRKLKRKEIVEYEYDRKIKLHEWNKRMKKDEIAKVAKKYKIKFDENTTKDELIKLIEYHEKLLQMK